ncbi:NAD(P)/FAD-dependent oxidoreductase [Ancylobacter sp. IITR112]|uniref:NAD(P)/FAD-dependent oxidoreductase n=1 Tax=Ancylobacter sp. IITR112 TaxID=3138073 RepID=UPI00352A0B9C
MCAIEAGRRGRRVVVLDHARAPGEKIRISGGGRCNFTNRDAGPRNYLSANPGFAISALKRYSAQDFIARIDRRGIAWHEKTLGQLFCDGSARQVVDMLTDDLREAGGALRLSTAISDIARGADGFTVASSDGAFACRSLVIASGGKSIPKMGATGFGYEVAERFGLALQPTRPGLVPLTLDPALLERLAPLAGVAVEARVSHGKTRFDEGLLFTHRGLSGPAILQISSYWRQGEEIALALAPQVDLFARLREMRAANGRQAPATALASLLPKRLAQLIAEREAGPANLADLSDKALRRIEAAVNDWRLKPTGSEGYRTAEVTLGGVDTAGLDSRTLEARTVPGLYFIGEVVDVTGWLGGYNFQWAWSSGWVAGQNA